MNLQMVKGVAFLSFRFMATTRRAGRHTRARARGKDGRGTRDDPKRRRHGVDGECTFHTFRVVARRASGMWVKGFELIDACAGGCVWGKQKRCV